MFSGCYIHSVDEKNRISIPSRFRSELAGPFMLTKGPDGCLWLLPMQQWEILLSKAANSLTVQRFFLASATECSLGAKGRCLLPDILRQHADIRPGDEVAIVGLMNRIEIWSARKWEMICSQLSGDRIQQEIPEFFNP